MDALTRVFSGGDPPDPEAVDAAVSAWRRGNRQAVIETVRRLLAERAVQPRGGLPDVVFPLLEECANTSDRGLAEMYAGLLANHLDPARRGAVHRTFARVLGQLSPMDLRVLLALDEQKRAEFEECLPQWAEQLLRRNLIPTGPRRAHRTLKDVCSLVGRRPGGNDLVAEAVELSLWNLFRAGLCADDSFTEKSYETRFGWHITPFAHRLLAGCAGPDGYWLDSVRERVASLLGDDWVHVADRAW